MSDAPDTSVPVGNTGAQSSTAESGIGATTPDAGVDDQNQRRDKRHHHKHRKHHHAKSNSQDEHKPNKPDLHDVVLDGESKTAASATSSNIEATPVAKSIRRASMIPPGVVVNRQQTMSTQHIQQHNKVINWLAHSANLHSTVHHGVAKDVPVAKPLTADNLAQHKRRRERSRPDRSRPGSANSRTHFFSASSKTLEAELSFQEMVDSLEHDIGEAMALAVSRKESSQSTYEQRRRKACVKGVRDKVANVVDSTWAQNIITALVVLNAILIGIETDYGPTGFYCEGGTEGHDCNEDSMMAAFYVDTVIVGIFNLEIVLKLFAHGENFFKDGWNIFDFVVILLSDMDLVLGAVPGIDLQAGLSAVRLLRVVRIFRLLKSVRELQELTEAFVSSAPGVMWVGVLLVMMFLVFSVVGTVSFGLNTGEAIQQAEYSEWFGTVGSSMYSLFQIMTLESWSMGIVREVMHEWNYSWLFFVTWICLSSYGILNLLASVFVEKIIEAKEKTEEQKKAQTSLERKEVTSLLHDYFYQMSSNDDGLNLEELKEGVKQEPLFRRILSDTGWMKDGSQAVDTLFEILDINGDGLVNYYEFLNIALSTDDALTKEDILKQRLNLKGKMDDLFSELNTLDKNIVDVLDITDDQSVSDGKDGRSENDTSPSGGGALSTVKEEQPRDLESKHRDVTASSVVHAATHHIFADCSREELTKICVNASVMTEHEASLSAANVSEKDMLQRLERKMRRTLMWWSN